MIAISAYVTAWLDLVLRWLHVVAAIAWIGSSFYFIALDLSLRPPADEQDAAGGVGGEAWEIHGGGFYHVLKYRVAPPRLPERLAWFKWEAYTTWLSGFALMLVLYYLHADVYLVDKSVADISTGWAIGASIGILAVGWLVYDGLCRLLGERDLLVALGLAGLTVGTAYLSSRLFAPRAAYLEVGAMLGTIMAANVFFVIIPGHWELVRAKQAGREPDPVWGIRGKQRSVHNNYLTLPVLFAMLAGHFPITYSHAHAWLILLAIMALSVWLRLFFNLRHEGRTVWWIPVSAAAGLALVAFLIRPAAAPPATGAPVPFATAQAIVTARCVPCHSQNPTYSGFSAAPKGIVFDTPEQIRSQASLIQALAVSATTMPLGNLTHMTPQERELLGRWIAQGAKTSG
jgi:uncharacterized membrane protein